MSHTQYARSPPNNLSRGLLAYQDQVAADTAARVNEYARFDGSSNGKDDLDAFRTVFPRGLGNREGIGIIGPARFWQSTRVTVPFTDVICAAFG